MRNMKSKQSGIRNWLKEIKGYNWINPLILFLLLHHFIYLAYSARCYFERDFVWIETVDEIPSKDAVSLMASLIVGIVLGILYMWLGGRREKIRNYWKNNYWKDIVCFCIIFGVAQIVSIALLQIGFDLNSQLGMFLEKMLWVTIFFFPQAIHIPFTIPGAIIYYIILGTFRNML